MAAGTTHRWRKHLAAGGALVMTAALSAAAIPALTPDDAKASSHREAPQISGLPQYDNTDVYAFVSPDKLDTTTLIANWVPFEEPAGGPNFYPFATDAWYDIHVDNDGDARADVTFRYDFEDTWTPGPEDSFTGNGTFLYNNGPVESLKDDNLLFRQTYKLSRFDEESGSWFTLLDKAPVAPSFVGKASMPNYAALRNAAIANYGKKSALGNKTASPAVSPSPGRRKTRSSSTCASSTCSTAVTCPRSGTTPWRDTTSTRSPCRCRPRTCSATPGIRSSVSGARRRG